MAGWLKFRWDKLREYPDLRFNKDLMGSLFGETNDFILDRRTVPWASAVNVSIKHRRSIQPCTDQIMRLLIRMRNMTNFLIRMFGNISEE